MAVESRSTPQPEPALPKNTIVVMPKTLPMNRGALWVVFWGVGLAMGLLLRSIIEGPVPTQVDASTAPAAAQAPGAAPTLEVNVRAVLELPTSTPTPPATGTPEVAALTPTINDCGTAEPGTVCKVPLPPQPTATAYPSCEQMDELTPGAWCIWPTEPSGLSASK